MASSDVSRISYNKETETIIIGIGERTNKSTFMRDIGNDVVKGIGCLDAKQHKNHNWRLKEIKTIEFVGSGSIEELTIANFRYEVKTENNFDLKNNFRLIFTMRLIGLKIIRRRMADGQCGLSGNTMDTKP